MIRRKNQTDDLLLSKTKTYETLNKQTHRKLQETLEFKVLKPKTFHFNPPIHTKGDWMIGLIDLKVYNSVFNKTKKNKFEFYTDTFDKFLFEEIKDEVEEILNITNVTDYHLEDETIALRIIKAYWHLRLERSSSDGYIILLLAYARSLFRDFESYLRKIVGLDEDDIRLILKQNNKKLVTYELDVGNYTIEDLLEALYPLGDHKGTLETKYDSLNNKTNLILTRFGSTFETLRFDKKSFLFIHY